jgi:pyruvate/2-oxoglutarate dehydrogenase complex dihydrolipoamide dehydrogenase (E3) component
VKGQSKPLYFFAQITTETISAMTRSLNTLEVPLKVTIIGAGAIGGLAGTHMARAGYDVTLVDQWREHVAAINANGMFIESRRINSRSTQNLGRSRRS